MPKGGFVQAGKDAAARMKQPEKCPHCKVQLTPGNKSEDGKLQMWDCPSCQSSFQREVP